MWIAVPSGLTLNFVYFVLALLVGKPDAPPNLSYVHRIL